MGEINILTHPVDNYSVSEEKTTVGKTEFKSYKFKFDPWYFTSTGGVALSTIIMVNVQIVRPESGCCYYVCSYKSVDREYYTLGTQPELRLLNSDEALL